MSDFKYTIEELDRQIAELQRTRDHLQRLASQQNGETTADHPKRLLAAKTDETVLDGAFRGVALSDAVMNVMEIFGRLHTSDIERYAHTIGKAETTSENLQSTIHTTMRRHERLGRVRKVGRGTFEIVKKS